MGAGIVEVFARAGLDVVGVEGTPELAAKGQERLTASADKALSRGKLDQAGRDALLGRITCTDDFAALADAQLVVEAVPEVMTIKHDIFTRLDGLVAPDAILASNTSSLSITEIAAGTADPGRVIGMHFFNPAPVLALVEVIHTPLTRPEVRDAVAELAVRLGKKPVVVGDKAGFVANDLLFGYLNRAVGMLEAGQISAADLDAAMHVGAGLPMGPLTLMDLVGLDVCAHISHVMYGATHRHLHAPNALLERMVAAGMLGRKSGSGFLVGDAAAAGADPSTPGAEAFTRIAVVGEGEFARELATQFGAEAPVSAEGDLRALAEADLVIEALGGPGDDEDEDQHQESLAGLLAAVSEAAPTAVIASTGAAAVGDLAGEVADGTRLVRLAVHEATAHGRLAEVGHLRHTAPADLDRLRATLAGAGLTPSIGLDRPGLVHDALLFSYLNEAVRMTQSGYASPADIDTAMVAGCGYPQGPFATLDQVGALTAVLVLQEIYEATGDTDLLPAELLVEHAVLELPFLGQDPRG